MESAEDDSGTEEDGDDENDYDGEVSGEDEMRRRVVLRPGGAANSRARSSGPASAQMNVYEHCEVHVHNYPRGRGGHLGGRARGAGRWSTRGTSMERRRRVVGMARMSGGGDIAPEKVKLSKAKRRKKRQRLTKKSHAVGYSSQE